MTRFPSDSNLYLDDDAIVRIDGLHEPRKERVQQLTKKILQAWELQQYESCYSLLVEFDRLSGCLPSELATLRKRMPAKRHLQHLRQIRSEATSMTRDGMHDSAYALCEIEKEGFDQADAEDQEAIDIEFRLILLLRQTVLANWRSAVKQEITELLQTCSQESIQKAQNILGLLEGKPLFEGTSGFYYDIHNAVKNAWYKFYVQEAKKTHGQKAWKQAMAWAGKAQQIHADCIDLNRIVEQCQKALQVRRRKVWVAGTCILVGLLATPFIYLQHWKAEFQDCLEKHDFKLALDIARKIEPYDKASGSYIKSIKYYNETERLYRAALDVVGASIHPQWVEWEMQTQKDFDGWEDVRDHHAIAERLQQAAGFYREILDRSTLLHLDNLLGGSVCLVNYWVLSESQETIITNKASILIYPSEYKITVSHVDYFPAIFSLQKEELVAKSQYRLNASLKPRDGVLTINTQIETKIYQGSSFVGFSGQPLNLKAKNTHTLWLKADGYKDKQIDVRLGPNQRITHSYEMQVAEGTLQIELLADPNIPSEILPKTVYVRLNDEGLEIEMLLLRKLTLDIGKYGVSLRVPGWKVLSSEPVRIRQNQKTTAQFSITPEKTTVRFESNVKASVWLGEKRIGNTGELIDIIPGMHAYTLKSPLYRNKNISLLSYPGDAEQRSVKMVSLIDESKLSFVTINAHRKNKVIKAAIYKKGRLVGQSGEPIALTPEVKHILVVKARGYDDRQVATSELEAGKTYTKPISVQLKKKDKGDGAIMSRLKKLGNWL